MGDEQYFWAFHRIVMEALAQMFLLWEEGFEDPLPGFMGNYDRLILLLNPGLISGQE